VHARNQLGAFVLRVGLRGALGGLPDLPSGGVAGGIEFGFRAAQEVYPFLMLLTVRGLKDRISQLAWVAIAIGFAVNI
jgi:hypothetical protein